MAYRDELDYGDEIRGVVCPDCGGSLVWKAGRAYCDEHRYVEPDVERTTPEKVYSDSDLQWLYDHGPELGNG